MPDQYLCSTCSVSFPTNLSRREHMREEWHVFNIKRKMCSWPSLSRQQYEDVVMPQEEAPCQPTHRPREPSPETEILPMASHDNDHNDGHDDATTTDTTRCLFCRHLSISIDENLKHMHFSHDFQIPDIDRLATDIEALLGYLSVLIEEFQSCLYCGIEKRSAEATRTHMVDKGHCMLDLSPESEIWEFWEPQPGVTDTPARKLPGDEEMELASGKIVQSRAIHHASRRHGRIPVNTLNAMALASRNTQEEHDNESESGTSTTSSALARRDAMGIVGLSQQQQRALAIRQRKTTSDELRARNQARWTLENMGNKVKQKHFKVGSICRSGLFIDPTMR